MGQALRTNHDAHGLGGTLGTIQCGADCLKPSVQGKASVDKNASLVTVTVKHRRSGFSQNVAEFPLMVVYFANKPVYGSEVRRNLLFKADAVVGQKANDGLLGLLRFRQGFGLRLGLVLPGLSDGGEDFAGNPIRESISFGLVRAEGELVNGGFGDETDLLRSSPKGEEFPHTLPSIWNARQKFSIPNDAKSSADILGNEPKIVVFNDCSDLVGMKRKHWGNLGSSHVNLTRVFHWSLQNERLRVLKTARERRTYSPKGILLAHTRSLWQEVYPETGNKKSLKLTGRRSVTREFSSSIVLPKHENPELSRGLPCTP